MNQDEYGTFAEQWLTPSVESVNELVWRMSDDASRRILTADYDFDCFVNKQHDAIRKMASTLGNNIFVCLSGGIDSQAACLLLQKAEIPFTAAIMRFSDDLNSHDVTSAVRFCNGYSIPYVLIDFNILTFLGRDLSQYVDKYDCPSPQLSAHCRFYELLIEQHSPSAIICGGNPPCIREGKWEFISNRSHSVWMKFARDNKYPLIGNLLGYSVDIALPFMIFQPDMPTDPAQRYRVKIHGMHRLGLGVIPQSQKFTGFELVKEHFTKMTGDGWTFEKWFRLPHHQKRPEYDSVLQLSDEVSSFLTMQHHIFNQQ